MNIALCTIVPHHESRENAQGSKLECIVKQCDALLKTRQKNIFDKHHGTRELLPLRTTQLVWLPESHVYTSSNKQRNFYFKRIPRTFNNLPPHIHALLYNPL